MKHAKQEVFRVFQIVLEVGLKYSHWGKVWENLIGGWILLSSTWNLRRSENNIL